MWTDFLIWAAWAIPTSALIGAIIGFVCSQGEG